MHTQLQRLGCLDSFNMVQNDVIDECFSLCFEVGKENDERRPSAFNELWTNVWCLAPEGEKLSL